MKVNDQVIARGPQSPSQPQVIAQPRQSARPRHDHDLVQAGMVTDHRLGRRFDEISDVGSRKPAAQGANRRCGEHHIADQAQPDEEDLQGSTVASSISMTGMSSLMG